MRLALLLVGLVLVAMPHSAKAASIDCATAKGALGLSICADPELHQLDQDLGAAYGRLAATASPSGKKLVERDEHDRRAFIEELCAPTNQICLMAAYRRATDSLARVGAQPAGGTMLPAEQFRLSRVTSFLAAFPRIDRPAEPWAKEFEQAAQQAVDDLRPEEAEVSAVIDYRPTYLADDLAAVAFSVRIIPKSTVHGLSHQAAFTYLPAKHREMRPTDLFQSGTTWSGFLAQQAFDGLQGQAKIGNWEFTASGPGELERAIADPANWLIRPEGLGLYLAPETIGPSVAGDHEVLIPWADLKPYLAEAPAFKIPSPEAAAPPSPSQP